MENEKITTNDYSDYILLKQLTPNERRKAEYYVKIGRLEKEKTEHGMAVDRNKYLSAIEHASISRKIENGGYRIDLSTPSKMNCLYRRLADMSKHNRDCCRTDSGLPRYVDENGYTCINLKDYIRPQVQLIAKKLECRPVEISNAIFEVIAKINKKDYSEDNE